MTTLESLCLVSVAPVAVAIDALDVSVTVTVPLFGAELGDAETVAACAVPEKTGKPAAVRTAATPKTVRVRRHVRRIIRLPWLYRNRLIVVGVLCAGLD